MKTYPNGYENSLLLHIANIRNSSSPSYGSDFVKGETLLPRVRVKIWVRRFYTLVAATGV